MARAKKETTTVTKNTETRVSKQPRPAPASAPAARSTRKPQAVSTQQIMERAYQLWQQRGGTHGSDVQDWLQAERELTGV